MTQLYRTKLELDITGSGMGSVKLDGEEVLHCTGIDVKLRVGEANRVVIHTLATSVVAKIENVELQTKPAKEKWFKWWPR